MRTVIFLGFIAVANAINKEWLFEEDMAIYGFVFICSVIMDLIDFQL